MFKRLIELIDGETWIEMGIDIKGEIYKGFLEKKAQGTKSGAGQHLTPRALIQTIVNNTARLCVMNLYLHRMGPTAAVRAPLVSAQPAVWRIHWPLTPANTSTSSSPIRPSAKNSALSLSPTRERCARDAEDCVRPLLDFDQQQTAQFRPARLCHS
jgi:hypothetical protein